MRMKTEPRVSAAGGLRALRIGSMVGATSWGILLVLSMLGILNHVLGVAAFASSDDERMMFALFAGVNLYAAVVLLTAYRRGEQWAWAITWVQVAAFALAFLFTGPGIGSAYLIIAGITALAQFAALPAFATTPGVSQGSADWLVTDSIDKKD